MAREAVAAQGGAWTFGVLASAVYDCKAYLMALRNRGRTPWIIAIDTSS
jgi:hypothetical protein